MAVLIGTGVLVASCTPGLDPRQAEACRIAAVAVLERADLELRAESPLVAEDGRPAGVAIDLRERAGEAALHRVECRFAAASRENPPELVELRTESGPLSEPRLIMLKRFWLGSPEANQSDPLRAERRRDLPSVPFPIAYALQHFLAALPNAATYSLLAAAYSLVYGLFGRINLAFGELAAVGGSAALIGATLVTAATPLAIVGVAGVFAIWAAASHGLVIERAVIWPLRRSTGQQGLVATIGLALFMQEYLRIVGGNTGRWLPSLLSDPIDIVRAEAFVVTLTPLSLLVGSVALVASGAVLGLLRFSGFGRDWRATADDPGAAALFGVDPRLLSVKTFMLACGLAGLAGAGVTLISGSVGVSYTTTLGLKALIAAILGGIGSVSGAFLGGLVIAAVEAIWSAYFPIVYRDLVVDALLVATLIFRPGGFFGYRDLLPRRL